MRNRRNTVIFKEEDKCRAFLKCLPTTCRRTLCEGALHINKEEEACYMIKFLQT